MNHIYLVMYDIADTRRRTKAALLLQRWGYERIQLSVFTGLQPPQANAKLWQELQQLLQAQNNAGDKVFCIAVSRQCFANMQVLGAFNADIDYLLGRQHTLYF